MTTNDYERTTDRQEKIPGFKQSVLQDSKVLIIGAGATGNEVLKNLALTGFGYVCIVDMDIISTSNLSRTVLFSASDVGRLKAKTAAQKYVEMNTCSGKADYIIGDVCVSLGEGIERQFDLVINCVDNDQTRFYMNEICKRLRIPFIDLGIGGLSWNVFPSSGDSDSPCYACMMTAQEEGKLLARVRNSCDVTRVIAAKNKIVPTIGVSSSMAAAKAVEEAIKVLHHKAAPDSSLPAPQYDYMILYNGQTGIMQRFKINKRHDCTHHDAYDDYGGVLISPLSAHMALRDVLTWINEKYEGNYRLSIFKDCSCVDRAFVTSAHCVHCGAPIDIYKSQSVITDSDVLCDNCRRHGYLPKQLSGAIRKTDFSLEDESRILEMTLLDIGVPLAHIVAFEDEDEQNPTLFIELSKDIHEVLTQIP